MSRAKLLVMRPVGCAVLVICGASCLSDDTSHAVPNPPIPVEYGLHLDTGELGTITVDGEDHGVHVGIGYTTVTTITIEITPNAGYHFVRIDWDDETETTDNPCQILMDRDRIGTVVIELD